MMMMMSSDTLKIDPETGERWRKDQPLTQSAWFEALLLLGVLGVSAAALWCCCQTLSPQWLPEEAYLHYKLARSLVEGHGMALWRQGQFVPANVPTPLYAVALAGLMALKGAVAKSTLIAVLRPLNAMAALALLPLLYAWLRGTLPKVVALLVVALLGVSPLFITHATNLGPLPWVWLASLWSLAAFNATAQAPQNKALGFHFYSLIAACAVLSALHPFGALWATVLGLGLLRWQGFKRWLLALAISGVLLGPLLFSQLSGPWLLKNASPNATGYVNLNPLSPRYVRPQEGLAPSLWARTEGSLQALGQSLLGVEPQAQQGWPLQTVQEDWLSTWLNQVRTSMLQWLPLLVVLALSLLPLLLVATPYTWWTGVEPLQGALGLWAWVALALSLLTSTVYLNWASLNPFSVLLPLTLLGSLSSLALLPRYSQNKLNVSLYQWSLKGAGALMAINLSLFALRQGYVVLSLNHQQAAGGGPKPNAVALMATEGALGPAAATLPVAEGSGKLQPGVNEPASKPTPEANTAESTPKAAPTQAVVHVPSAPSKAPVPQSAVAYLAADTLPQAATREVPPLPTASPHGLSAGVSVGRTPAQGFLPLSRLRFWVQANLPAQARLMVGNPTQAGYFYQRPALPYPSLNLSEADKLRYLHQADFIVQEPLASDPHSAWLNSVVNVAEGHLRLVYQEAQSPYLVWQVLHGAPVPR
jgi:hypothetical protein